MMRNRTRFLIPFLAVGLATAACSSGGTPPATQGSAPAQSAAAPADGKSLPRNETLYTSGTMWGPPANWNPLREWDSATGTKGLLYETLFLYDPNTDQFQPWLAESGEWTGDKEYTLKVRSGITWSDGKPFTAEDVVFTFELGKTETVPYHNMWDFLESAEVVDQQTAKFTFKEARYQQWANHIYQRAIVPKHIWSSVPAAEVVDYANENPVGTGAYKYLSHDQDRQTWVKRDDWWGIKALGKEVKPKYIVDIVNSSNEVAMGLLLQKGLDLSNNFLPGVANLVSGNFGISTYYKEAPYMLSANTAWLVLNTTKKPMDDPAFRKAMAYSVDTKRIVENVYGNLVKASDPSGLLPQWDKYIDKSVTGSLGFSYDPDKAKQLLASAGYKDTDGDGFINNKDGSKIDLKIIVPTGWTDWMESIRVISASAKDVGINLNPEFPDYNALVEQRSTGKFDMLINNERQLSNTPERYYDYVFNLPVQKLQNTRNFGRYENEDAWKLVNQLDATKTEDVEGMKTITSQLQKIQLEEMPIIPLWYNGLWSQVSNAVWKNWPSDAQGAPKNPPTMWRNWLELGGIYTLFELQPAGA